MKRNMLNRVVKMNKYILSKTLIFFIGILFGSFFTYISIHQEYFYSESYTTEDYNQSHDHIFELMNYTDTLLTIDYVSGGYCIRYNKLPKCNEK